MQECEAEYPYLSHSCDYPVCQKAKTKDQMEGLQMGADDYIPKPFSLAILTTKIQNMMRTRRRMLERILNLWKWNRKRLRSTPWMKLY